MGPATPPAFRDMVVDHADPVYKCIDNFGTDKAEPPAFHVFRDAVAERGRDWHFTKVGEVVDLRAAINESPEIRIEAALLVLNVEDGAGIAAGAVDFQPVADDSFILAKRLKLCNSHCGSQMHVKVVKGRLAAGALPEHHVPAEPGLRTPKREHLEKMPVVMDRHAPLGVVVMGEDVLTETVA